VGLHPCYRQAVYRPEFCRRSLHRVLIPQPAKTRSLSLSEYSLAYRNTHQYSQKEEEGEGEEYLGLGLAVRFKHRVFALYISTSTVVL
jgi:hypothetical protein